MAVKSKTRRKGTKPDHAGSKRVYTTLLSRKATGTPAVQPRVNPDWSVTLVPTSVAATPAANANVPVGPLAGHIYGLMDGVTRADSLAIARAVKAGAEKGKTPESVARVIAREADLDPDRALLTATTELTRYNALGVLAEGPSRVMFVAHVGCCKQCSALHGTEYASEDAHEAVPAHPGCKCRLQPVPTTNSSFFADCPRDAGGHCKVGPGNSDLPDHTRPTLTPEESFAVREYTRQSFGLNNALRGLREMTPAAVALHAKLTAVMSKAAVMDKPVDVISGRQVPTSQLKEFLGRLHAAHGSGTPISFPEYLSTSVHHKVDTDFEGPVTFHIKAIHGLDAAPHTTFTRPKQNERELLLPAGSRFRISKIVHDKESDHHHVHLEQLHPGVVLNESYFGSCERDKAGHCLPGGTSGTSGTKPTAAQPRFTLPERHERPAATTHEGVPTQHAADITPQEARHALQYREGFNLITGNSGPNTGLPEGTRPKDLTPVERGALQKYSYLNDRVLNAQLRGKEPPGKPPYGDAFYDEMHKAMESAFQKAPVLAKPVRVVRGMKLDPAALDAFQKQMSEAHAGGKDVTFSGYTSTARPTGVLAKLGLSSGVGKSFRGNVTLKINAVHGLDMKPHSQLPTEEEFLLPHGSRFKVKAVTKKGDGYHVELDQLPPSKPKPEGK